MYRRCSNHTICGRCGSNHRTNRCPAHSCSHCGEKHRSDKCPSRIRPVCGHCSYAAHRTDRCPTHTACGGCGSLAHLTFRCPTKAKCGHCTSSAHRTDRCYITQGLRYRRYIYSLEGDKMRRKVLNIYGTKQAAHKWHRCITASSSLHG